MNALEMTNEYVQNARTFTNKPYRRSYRKMIRRWWLAGYRNETLGYPMIGTNFEAPLRDAWRAGEAARAKNTGRIS